ncbi:lytic transglycosylase domain-containing protein [Methylotenera versatilis]|uniref:Lytic transglycosylase catalytic n=1 Tax=Methylotenera versatilis (strain 301) TaxID=666681 RepID=D7DMF5_METV0|nr:lytic transglycosylase domain-containing protein [Methylotenera versatilis]ADI28866.1 Lytic transglycosylase catalytic [Methylotenera versatilis 301]
MNRHLIVKIVLFVLGIGATHHVLADVFAFEDESGTVTLTNQPNDSRYTLILESPKVSAPALAVITNSLPPSVSSIPFRALVDEVAHTNNVEAALLHAVIATESNYITRAVSRKGAVGLMQLMPATAKRYGVKDVYDPVQNVQGGTRYLKDLLKLFDNNVRLTLAAYNAGETAVARFGNKVPPYPETREYVNKVMGLYNQYRVNSIQLTL